MSTTRRPPAPPLEPQRIYSLAQIARILQMRTDTVRQMAVDGVIPMIEFRGARGYRFLGWQVRAWLDGLQAESWDKAKVTGAFENPEEPNILYADFG